MAGIRFKVDVASIQPLARRVGEMAAIDTGTLMPRLGEYLQRSTQERFRTQAGPDGTPWAALRPRTLARKKRNRDKVLTERGFLRKMIFWQVTAPGRVEVFSDRVYGATHQFGRDKIPARPFLGVSAEDEAEMRSIVADWAAELGFK